jgi:pimeloyl-ACP methyl ester carboxylesterase
MTSHFFNHSLVKLHYYRFGNGPKAMLCFHGYGMHGKQFSVLAGLLGEQYTFYGFDLFFHKETKLIDQSFAHLKRGISKLDFAGLMADFCVHEAIGRYSLMSYSMGTHYATALAETDSAHIDQLFMLAPSFLKIFRPFQVMSMNPIANFAFRKLFLSQQGIKITLDVCKKLKLIDQKSHLILSAEMATVALREAFYANVTYLRHLQISEGDWVKTLNAHHVACFFIFGARDRMYPNNLADQVMAKLNSATKLTIDEDHDMVNSNLPAAIQHLMYDH